MKWSWPACIEQAEEQGSDFAPIFVLPEPANHAVHGSTVFDLDHGSLAVLIGEIGHFGDDAIATCRLEFVEPALGDLLGIGLWSEVPRRLQPGEQVFQPSATLVKRLVSQVFAGIGQQVEGDQFGGGGLGEHHHPGFGGMDALLEGVELGDPADDDNHLAIDHRSPRGVVRERVSVRGNSEAAAAGCESRGESPVPTTRWSGIRPISARR